MKLMHTLVAAAIAALALGAQAQTVRIANQGDALSMDPHSIPMVKAIIRRSSLADAEALASAALKSGSQQETTRLIHEAMGPQFAADLEAFLPGADA